ncbi:SAM-dependent methyltransferase [Nocardiopsis gilva YIM 90087]|uniref:SAM-dependent methyltransferase n=1 Tax=Nocardiopsis gilva YIM 90087 TaxID=1235441 RepID=A0A223S9G1_9ACTN|nr:SAM-dependent methyltransferase [Nocardiopsis gilva]ASU84764.1 SAM-dependent methyltransferase [Nocardiopsis gilva YIM 90087]
MPRFETPRFLKNLGARYNPPEQVDMTKPNIARVYSYFLGGKDHFEVDREMANYAAEIVPGVNEIAMGNRAFVQRAVRYLATERGVRQFLDIGSGLPTEANVHEVAHETAADSRIVYVDNDPIVLAHARAILSDIDTTDVIKADLRRPEDILTAPETRKLLDFNRPIGLMLGGILHHLADDEGPERLAQELCDALAPGSFLAISHFSRPERQLHPGEHDRALSLERAFIDKLGTGRWRDRDEILSYFCGWELVEPGLVPLEEWRPLPPKARVAGAYSMSPMTRLLICGGVARKN